MLVAPNFVVPILRVHGRCAGTVDRTSVPKATVYEDCDPRWTEHNVGPPPQVRERGNVNPITQTRRVE